VPIDPRAPVIVGVGAMTQHVTDPTGGLDALELMAEATDRAGSDSGASGALGALDLVLASRGIWTYRDPGRVIAARFGATDVRSIVAEIGILQQSLLTRAARAIADGDADVVLVCGTEAKHRSLLAQKAGIVLDDPDPSATAPDEVLQPVGEILTRTEIERELAVPAHQYASIESAIAHAEGRTPPEQREHAAALWARFASVAAGNPDAWDRSAPSAEAIATPGPGNRAIAVPYTKLLCSQWNVDQAVAILLMATEKADSLRVARDRRVFAHAAAESNQMVPLPRRAEIHRWPAFEAVAEALGLTAGGTELPSVVEIYSCFPAAVQVQARALGLPLDAPLTVSGGMTFGGGPLNSAALQAMAPFVRRLRDEPDQRGLTTSVSGMITKPGASVWSATPPVGDGFRSADVTEAATDRTETRDLVPDAVGDAVVAAHTVVFDGGEPARAVAVLDIAGGRTVARSGDRDLALDMSRADWVGRAVRVEAPGAFVAP
jgi:acetyl-CoA C-acetyltransferase